MTLFKGGGSSPAICATEGDSGDLNTGPSLVFKWSKVVRLPNGPLFEY